MSIELEHAIGCNVEYNRILQLHPNGQDYVKAVGGVVIQGSLNDPHEQSFMQGHDDFITCLAVSYGGQMAATGQKGQNADVILWSLTEKRALFKFEEQDHGIDSLCFSHDDRLLCACSDIVDQRMFVYDTQNGLILAWSYITPKPTLCILSGGMVKDIKRRETGEYLFAACGAKALSLWHLDAVRGELTSHPVTAAGKESREFVCMAFTPDYEYLFAGTLTGDVAIALMKNRVIQNWVSVCTGGALSIVCLPSPGESCRIVVGGGDGTITLLTGPEARCVREDKQVRLDGALASMSLARDGAEVMVVSTAGTSFQVRTKDLSVKLHNQASPGENYDIAYPGNMSDMFLTCCSDGIVTCWDANDYSARVRCAAKEGSHPICVAASEDIIVTGCSDDRLLCYDFAKGQKLWHIDNAHKGGATAVKIAANVRFVVSGGADGEVRIWELKTRDMISHMKEHLGRINELKLFPNDQYAITASRDRCLLTWDLRTEKRLTQHREKHGGINCLAIASNQTSVITAGQEKTLTYWDLRMADPIRCVELDEEINSISMSPDDRYIATAGTGQVVKVYDVNSSQVMSTGTGHSRSIKKLSFSPDGKQVVSVGLDHSIMVWNFYAGQ